MEAARHFGDCTECGPTHDKCICKKCKAKFTEMMKICENDELAIERYKRHWEETCGSGKFDIIFNS